MPTRVQKAVQRGNEHTIQVENIELRIPCQPPAQGGDMDIQQQQLARLSSGEDMEQLILGTESGEFTDDVKPASHPKWRVYAAVVGGVLVAGVLAAAVGAAAHGHPLTELMQAES